jgi:predicted transcriptional regulator
MPTDEPIMFLSLRPRFAELILEGSKTTELRRVKPAVPIGSAVLLYASSPSMILLGQAKIEAIHVGKLDRIWQAFGPSTGITRAEFNDYFAGLEDAVAISLTNIRHLEQPRPLSDLRQRIAGFRPPQSYRYLSGREVAALM